MTVYRSRKNVTETFDSLKVTLYDVNTRTRQVCISAVFAVDQCLSVCPSATFVYCIQTTNDYRLSSNFFIGQVAHHSFLLRNVDNTSQVEDQSVPVLMTLSDLETGGVIFSR